MGMSGQSAIVINHSGPIRRRRFAGTCWRGKWTLLLVFLTPIGVGMLSAEEAPPAVRSAAQLLEAGDALAKEKNYDGALLQYKEAYEVIVPKLRSLPFREPVTPRLMVRSELKNYMAEELTRDYPEPQMRLMDRSLKVLGFAPSTLDLKETLLNLLTEEVGGFYNPRTKEMFLIREDPVKRSLLARLLMGPEFDPREQRVTLAHEMAHALADQHFDLLELFELTKGNDDLALAVTSLIEGEATVVMLGELLETDDSSELLVDLPPERIDAMFRLVSWIAPFTSGRTFRSSPKILRESLIFPYHKGTVFVLHLTNQGGWGAVNTAFGQPPLSTEQILHPEKYLGPEPDWPTAVELPKLAEQLGDSWSALGGNVLGEMQIQILLENIPGAQQAAAGWDGDRYEVFEHEDGRLAVGWYSTWDSDEDAREFAIAAAHYFGSQLVSTDGNSDALRAQSRESFPGDSEARGAFRRNGVEDPESESSSLLVEWRGSDVSVLFGFSAAEAVELEELIWRSQKAPLRLER